MAGRRQPRLRLGRDGLVAGQLMGIDVDGRLHAGDIVLPDMQHLDEPALDPARDAGILQLAQIADLVQAIRIANV
jgi:hypothetical protein